MKANPTPPTTKDDEMDAIDKIILKPAHWQLDDYVKAKSQLTAFITKELRDIINRKTGLITTHDEMEAFDKLRTEQRKIAMSKGYNLELTERGGEYEVIV